MSHERFLNDRVNMFDLFYEAYQNLIDDILLEETMNRSMEDEQLKRNTQVKVSLEKVKYNGDECECEICFEKVKQGDKIYNLDCFHKFHADCLMEWLHYKQDCPVCRCKIK